MPAGIVTNGVIVRVLGGKMRQFNRFPPRALPFRLFLIVAAALLLVAAFTPSANADLIAYFNFEDSTVDGTPDFTSDSPPAFLGATTVITTDYSSTNMSSVTPGVPLNVAAGDPDPNVLGLGLRRSYLNNPANFDIPLFSSQGFYSNMTVSFAFRVADEGFNNVTLFYSTNGGGTFTNSGNSAPIPTIVGSTGVISLAVPAAANNENLLVLRLEFTGGDTANHDDDLQLVIDNIQVNGTIIPEPTTTAGGLLGVLGLCWFQRRRLRLLFPRLRRT
jgi:hypothetical protein